MFSVHQAVDESLGVSQLIVSESEGLTEEELLEAQEALKVINLFISFTIFVKVFLNIQFPH